MPLFFGLYIKTFVCLLSLKQKLKLMTTLNKLKLLLFRVFLTANPIILLVILGISFFSDKYALIMLNFEHWVFVITFLLSIPQIIENYKNGDYEKD